MSWVPGSARSRGASTKSAGPRVGLSFVAAGVEVADDGRRCWRCRGMRPGRPTAGGSLAWIDRRGNATPHCPSWAGTPRAGRLLTRVRARKAWRGLRRKYSVKNIVAKDPHRARFPETVHCFMGHRARVLRALTRCSFTGYLPSQSRPASWLTPCAVNTRPAVSAAGSFPVVRYSIAGTGEDEWSPLAAELTAQCPAGTGVGRALCRLSVSIQRTTFYRT